MSELIEKRPDSGQVNVAAGTLSQGDVVQQKKACAVDESARRNATVDGEIPPKKRKTRRGKSKRRHPYIKNKIRKSVCKPEAPYNSNQFLLADHGDMEQLAEDLRHIDRVSTSTVTRTRDSSFSVDSDAEFYSSPDDEEEYLIRDFADQYESLQVERLHALSKDELIREFLVLENRVEALSKRLRKRCGGGGQGAGDGQDQVQEVESSVAARAESPDLRGEVERLTVENEALRRENELLRAKVSSVSCSSGSADSETDSSDSCSSSSSSSSSSASRSSGAVSPLTAQKQAEVPRGLAVAAAFPQVMEDVEVDVEDEEEVKQLEEDAGEVDYSQLNGQATPPAIDSSV